MAAKHATFGKDRVVKSSESFIEKALTGGHGPSEDIHDYPVDRPDQKIKTAFAMDNVNLALDIESSLKDIGGIGGSVDNLKHSLTGASAVNEEVGAVGKLKHIIIPGH
jgi:hypothetical protein